MSVVTQVTPQMIEDCRRELPPVQVCLAGKVHWARTSGRLNQFCTVSLTNAGTLHRGSRLFWDERYSWESVCRAVVSGVPLQGTINF